MSSMHHVENHHRHVGVFYPHSLHQRVYSLVLIPLAAVTATIILISYFGASTVETYPGALTYGVLFSALGATFSRLLAGYILALALSLPLALLVTHSPLAEKIFLPLFDVMQSLPVLAFFPVIIVFFVHYGFYNGAAIFVLFITMLWNIVFSLVGGLRVIPADIKAAGRIFGLRGWRYIQKILLPASIPYLVTGSLLAFASGWNIVIVAEVLHTYLPGATTSSDLFGIGSILVHTAAGGQHSSFIRAMLVLTAAIAVLNFFVWQKLLNYAERFKFE
jgi:NitT/TauT family transport system permease protein